MRFSQYFQTVCDLNGVSSIRKAASFFSIGKSGVERIKAGECDIPTENMVKKVSAISGKAVETIYNELDYLPIYNSYAINKDIKEIIDYRDLHLPDGKEAEKAVSDYFRDYYASATNNHFDMWNKKHVLGANDNPEWITDFWVYDYDNQKKICFDLFQHYTSGNAFLSTDDNFRIFITRMLSISDCDEYVIVFMDENEAKYILENQKNRIVNTTVKVSVSYYCKTTGIFNIERLDQSRYKGL